MQHGHGRGHEVRLRYAKWFDSPDFDSFEASLAFDFGPPSRGAKEGGMGNGEERGGRVARRCLLKFLCSRPSS